MRPDGLKQFKKMKYAGIKNFMQVTKYKFDGDAISIHDDDQEIRFPIKSKDGSVKVDELVLSAAAFMLESWAIMEQLKDSGKIEITADSAKIRKEITLSTDKLWEALWHYDQYKKRLNKHVKLTNQPTAKESKNDSSNDDSKQ